MTWFFANSEMILALIWEHITLSFPTIVFSVLLSIPLGKLAQSKPRFGGILVSTTSLLYAIPSLPLLIIIPVILGLPLRSKATMITALTIYGVAVLARTAADAFNSVDGQLRDTATAIGNSKSLVFWRYELPLASPVLLSGVRVVSVATIGLVTIGAVIGVPSLGTLITDGFQRGIQAEVLTGIITTVILALIFDAVILVAGKLALPWHSTSDTRNSGVTA